MKWDVNTANPANGKERTITVDAPTAKAAEEKVRGHGLLVQGVPVLVAGGDDEPAGDVLDYRSKGSAQPEATATVDVGRYPEIVAGAQALRFMAMLSLAFGVLTSAGAVLVFLGGMNDPLVALLKALSAAAGAIWFFVGWVFLKMAAALALAVRDMAINSFDKK